MRSAATLTGVFAAALATVAVAFAATPASGVYFDGVSAHKHYSVEVLTMCAASGCKKASSVSIDLSVGKQGHTGGKCPYAIDALGGTLSKGRFSASGQYYLTGKKIVTFAMSGTFTSAKRLTGRIMGPKACGGSDTFAAKPAPPT